MSWEAALVARLMAAPAVFQRTGRSIGWDDLAADTTFPAIMLQTITDQRPQNHDGFDPFWPTRVQVNCLARTKLEAIALREAVIATLVPYAEQDGTIFLRSFVDGGGSDAERTTTGRLCRERTDLIVWHN